MMSLHERSGVYFIYIGGIYSTDIFSHYVSVLEFLNLWQTGIWELYSLGEGVN